MSNDFSIAIPSGGIVVVGFAVWFMYSGEVSAAMYCITLIAVMSVIASYHHYD